MIYDFIIHNNWRFVLNEYIKSMQSLVSIRTTDIMRHTRDDPREDETKGNICCFITFFSSAQHCMYTRSLAFTVTLKNYFFLTHI